MSGRPSRRSVALRRTVGPPVRHVLDFCWCPAILVNRSKCVRGGTAGGDPGGEPCGIGRQPACRRTAEGCQKAAKAGAKVGDDVGMAMMLRPKRLGRWRFFGRGSRPAGRSREVCGRVAGCHGMRRVPPSHRRNRRPVRCCRDAADRQHGFYGAKLPLVDRDPDGYAISRVSVGRLDTALAIVQPAQTVGLRVAVRLPRVVHPHSRRLAGFAHHQDVRCDRPRRHCRPGSPEGRTRLHPPRPDGHLAQFEVSRQSPAGRGGRSQHVRHHRTELLRCVDAGEYRSGSRRVGPAARLATPALAATFRPSRRARPAPSANGLTAAAGTAFGSGIENEPRRQPPIVVFLLRRWTGIGRDQSTGPIVAPDVDVTKTAIHSTITACLVWTASWQCSVNRV